MTRNTPYQGSYNQGQAQSYYNQSGYDGQQSQYNAQYGAGQGQGQGYNQPGPGYNQSGPEYSQPGYGGEDRPSQQSYYGSGDQQYQQHPQPAYGDDQRSYGEQRPYGAPSPYQQPASPPQHAGASFGEETNTSNNRDYYSSYHTSGPEVDNFKSHFDQPTPGQNDSTYGGASAYGQQGYSADAQEGDRGVLGAMGGAAAGGIAGHKMGRHGILGAVGGALAGSIAEDQWKKHQHGKDEQQQHHQQQGWAGQQPVHNAPVPAGNFHASSRDVRLERERFLVAECADTSGHLRRSEIDLNDCLTNNNGHFGWGRGGNFHASARNVRLADGGQTLEAELADVEGRFRHDRIWLNEKIENDNGNLHLV